MLESISECRTKTQMFTRKYNRLSAGIDEWLNVKKYH